jgi:hypothetical protein
MAGEPVPHHSRLRQGKPAGGDGECVEGGSHRHEHEQAARAAVHDGAVRGAERRHGVVEVLGQRQRPCVAVRVNNGSCMSHEDAHMNL